MHSKGGGRSRAPPTPQHAMQNNTAVVVHGLSKSPEHNGKPGKILSFDSDKGRYEVDLDGNTLSLRPSNLCQTCRAKIHMIQSQPELNGQSCSIQNYKKEDNRYQVQLHNKM